MGFFLQDYHLVKLLTAISLLQWFCVANKEWSSEPPEESFNLHCNRFKSQKNMSLICGN